jgi:prepilin-type N-terminal cleavage/methylation domain-containing protein
MGRIRGRRDRQGFTVVEVVVTVTLLALVLGVVIDILIVGMQSPSDSRAQLAPAEAELSIARFVSTDVLPSFSATPNGTACGVTGAALVTTEKSLPTVAKADEAVAYSLGPEGLTRSTCAIGATSATTSTVVATGVTLFVATCRSPGTCGSVHIQAATATSNGTDHPFSLDITRRPPK